MTELYRTRTINRRRTRNEIAQLDQQIVDVLDEDHPQSVRHVFYRMTDPRLPEPVEKSERGYRHVQDRIVKLRRAHCVPYSWITDATRQGYHVQTFASAADFLTRMNGLYRADLWSTTDVYCEVWVESRSIASVVLNDCQELAVSLMPAGGFSSISFAYDDAKFINENHGGREVVIFYIGDYDPAGVLIDTSLQRELRRHLHPDVSLTIERLGITAEQIDTYDLPTKARKPSDRRSPEVTHTVEAEALPAGVMRGLLRNRIESLLPPHALEIARIAEASERQYIQGVAEMLGGSS